MFGDIYVRTIFLLSAMLAVVCLGSPSTAAETNIEVSIAIPQRNGKRVLEYSNHAAHFHVIVANTANEPQRIWREWCSWGYYALSFEFTDLKGKTWTATKKPREWDKNFPDYWTIPPHECLVLDVQFTDTDVWEGFPRPSGVSQAFTMRAVFEVRPDKESRESSVWSGRAASKWDDYVFYR